MKFETYLDKRHEWRWRLKASNGKIIADSKAISNVLTVCMGLIWYDKPISLQRLFVLKTININSKAPQGAFISSRFLTSVPCLYCLLLSLLGRVGLLSPLVIYTPITNRDYFVSFCDYFIDLQRNLFLKK